MKRLAFAPLLLVGTLASCGQSELPSTGTPAATTGSMLIAVSPNTASIVAVAQTGSQTYTLKSGTELTLPADKYQVTLSQTGYATQVDNLTVTAGKTTTAAYTLAVSQ